MNTGIVGRSLRESPWFSGGHLRLARTKSEFDSPDLPFFIFLKIEFILAT